MHGLVDCTTEKCSSACQETESLNPNNAMEDAMSGVQIAKLAVLSLLPVNHCDTTQS